MPTVLRLDGFRFHFYSNEGAEPAHVHAENGDGECKFWLDPVALASNRGVKPRDVRVAERIVYEQRDFFLTRFHEFHGH